MIKNKNKHYAKECDINTDEEYKKFEQRVRAKKDAILRKMKNDQFFGKNRDLTFNNSS